MYFFKFTALFLIFFLKNVYLYGDECQNFIKSVLEIPIPQEGMVTDGQQPKNDIGIFFHTEYDFEKNIIKIKRDINNYPILKNGGFHYREGLKSFNENLEKYFN